MTLDVTTLSLVLFLVYLGSSLVSILMALSGRSFRGAWLWVLGQSLMAAGALTMFLRPLGPVWVSIIFGNGAYIASCLLFAHAVWVFRFQTRFPRLLYGLLPVALLSFWFTFDESFAVRAEVFSFWTILGSFFAAWLLVWRVERQFRMANGITSLPFLGVGLASVARLAANLGAGSSAQNFYNQSGVNVWYMLGSVLISTVTLFGYFMMTGIRAEQILSRKDDEIEARNRKLLASSRAKDLFFSIIAHDLRGPIGGAARYARKHLFGKMSGLEARYAEVETLVSALEKTNEFLEKLLWWSRAQLQDWTPARTPLDLDEVLSHAVALVQSAADLKEIAIQVGPAGIQPVADPESVLMIVVNLLSNAVKFSLPGRKVQMTVGEQSGLCWITVQDEGVGMDAATLDRLFRIEDKLTTHGTSGERGSGLGLILSQSLAERNDGGVTVESQPGVGTRATLWLPTRNPELRT